MIKYAKVINEQTGLCEVGIGTNSKFYKSIGMKEQDVSQSDIDGKWYLSDKCPMKSDEDKLAEAKQAKLNEATDKAYSFENKDALITVSATNMMSRSSETYHIEATLTNNIKLSAYAQALDESETLPWNTKENVNVLLNKAACTTLTELMSQLNAKLWTVDFPTFLAQIEAAQTVEDVEAIEIVYKNPEEIIDVNVSTEKEEVSDENTPDNDIPEVQEDSDIQEDTAGETE
ncbi:MAG: hypothetical protein V8R83_09345 [Candidatus Gastranaerophilaceae bacterium]|jgi:hypothetical protein|nr:MAG TPA: protein of unknown function (DUF4376) [Caudoviricetes sp.]